MPGPAQLGLVDVLIIVTLAIVAIGALRHRRGLLATVGSAAAAALTCWLVAGGVIAWGPSSWRSTVEQSALLHIVQPPVQAFNDLGRLVDAKSGSFAPAGSAHH